MTKAIARPPAPFATDRIGVREIVFRRRNRDVRATVDPSEYTCPVLIGQIADAWIDYHHAAALKRPDEYGVAVRSFAEFAGPHMAKLGHDPALARLDDDRIDVAEVVHAWEDHLLSAYSENSQRPWALASCLLTLLHHRGERDPLMPDKLRRRAAAPTTMRRATSQVLDEFTNTERLALKKAAQDDLRALEKRLAWGRTLLAEGRDPREHGWRDLPNLVWAARHRLLTSAELLEHLSSRVETWPQQLQEVHAAGQRQGAFGLLRGVYGLLFPQELDLQPFRVLLLLLMLDCTTEELHALQIPDLEFNSHGVRVVQTKNRAERVRADFHLNDPEPDPSQEAGELVYEGRGEWDVPGLLRRLLKVNELTRAAFDCEPWLFTAVEAKGRTTMVAGFARFTEDKRRFTHWIGSHRTADGTAALDISQPHEARRLRKTAKTTRAVALGGTLSDLAADDHSIQVFHRYYAHGTTAHVLAGKAINRAQQRVFDKLAATPTLVTEEARADLGEPEVADALGVTPEQGAALRDGELDMGVTNCKNPYDSQFSTPGSLCHVAPAICMVCDNAVVFISQLPQQLLLFDHIEHMRLVLPPQQWHTVWGRQAKALAQVFEECAEHLPAARKTIEEQDLQLNLPLGMRTEYNR
ncbi:hypothetical protein ABT288_15220 [Streptomyces sp. NPDC001093]|uniref:hypothetical protein n=1 Tax=Streptomyces sp. NPDC001093 TaxID=3154376 RepID=UPI00331F5002